jgi:hypothetical protein
MVLKKTKTKLGKSKKLKKKSQRYGKVLKSSNLHNPATMFYHPLSPKNLPFGGGALSNTTPLNIHANYSNMSNAFSPTNPNPNSTRYVKMSQPNNQNLSPSPLFSNKFINKVRASVATRKQNIKWTKNKLYNNPITVNNNRKLPALNKRPAPKPPNVLTLTDNNSFGFNKLKNKSHTLILEKERYAVPNDFKNYKNEGYDEYEV